MEEVLDISGIPYCRLGLTAYGETLLHSNGLQSEYQQVILNIINSLKDGIVQRYEIIGDEEEKKYFTNISQKSLEKIWDNQEDSAYDKYLKT